MGTLTTLTRWTRSDYVISRVVLIAIAIAVPVASVGVVLWDWARGNPMTAPVRVDDTAPLPESLLTARSGARLEWDGTALAHLADPGTGVRVSALLAALVVAAVAVLSCLVLLRLLRQAQAGEPFGPGVQRGLRMLALLMLAAGLLWPTLSAFAAAEVIRAATDASVSPSLEINFIWVGVALLLLFLAEVFRIGARMADDVEGLV